MVSPLIWLKTGSVERKQHRKPISINFRVGYCFPLYIFIINSLCCDKFKIKYTLSFYNLNEFNFNLFITK